MSSQFDKSGFRLPRNLRVHKPHHVSHPITELIFASPLEFRYSNDYEVIRVTHEMLALIQEGAEEYQDETSNGYCFGPLYDLDTYVFLGEHGVKGGTTGFIEVKAAKKKYHEGKKTNNFDTVCFPIKYNFPPYISRLDLQDYSEIKWIGKVQPTSDENHIVYCHYHVNTDNCIDSILVDNGFFYSVESETSETSEDVRDSQSNEEKETVV